LLLPAFWQGQPVFWQQQNLWKPIGKNSPAQPALLIIKAVVSSCGNVEQQSFAAAGQK
jgi:hypothetical protein